MDNINNILDNDEQIIKSYKPNRFRMIFLALVPTLIFFLAGVAMFVFGVLGIFGIIQFVDKDTGVHDITGPIILLIMGVVFMSVLFGTLITSALSYNKTKYYVTNKRIIISHGVIGIDYKSLALESILAIDVRVDFVDKLVRPNTGTIMFGSAAMPMMRSNNNGGAISGYTFAYIENPYEAYKEIKELVKK